MAVTREFREFIARGNVIDLAVGVIIGAAFGKIVTTLVEGIIMPPIGLVPWPHRLSPASSTCSTPQGCPASLADAKAKGVPVIAYGQFINDIISFLIVAFAVFLLVKQVNRIKRLPRKERRGTSTKSVPTARRRYPIKATRCPELYVAVVGLRWSSEYGGCQISTCTPSSTTRSGGRRKNAGRADGVPRHQRRTASPARSPCRGGRCHEDRLASQEIRHVVGVDVEARGSARDAQRVWARADPP